MYISETASVYLGLAQIELTGSNLFDYIHPSDKQDFNSLLCLNSTDYSDINNCIGNEFELPRSFCLRIKCVLPKRNAGLVSSGYKVIHFNGYLKVKLSKTVIDNKFYQTEDWQTQTLVAVGHSFLPSASTEVKLAKDAYIIKAEIDLKLTHIDESLARLIGFDMSETIGQSLYKFLFGTNPNDLAKAHNDVLKKGQAVTGYLKLMNKSGGYFWSQLYLVSLNSSRNSTKVRHIVGACFVLSKNCVDASCACLLNPKQDIFTPSMIKSQSTISPQTSIIDNKFDSIGCSNFKTNNKKVRLDASIETTKYLESQQSFTHKPSTANDTIQDICLSLSSSASSVPIVFSPIGNNRRTSGDSISTSSETSNKAHSVSLASTNSLANSELNFEIPFLVQEQSNNYGIDGRNERYDMKDNVSCYSTLQTHLNCYQNLTYDHQHYDNNMTKASGFHGYSSRTSANINQIKYNISTPESNNTSEHSTFSKAHLTYCKQNQHKRREDDNNYIKESTSSGLNIAEYSCCYELLSYQNYNSICRLSEDDKKHCNQ